MSQATSQTPAAEPSFVLPPLPYAFDALEPYIDAKTMEIHHDKHHGAYVTNLNKAIEGNTELQRFTVDELIAQIDRVPENIRTAVRNNGGGHANHSMFWTIMKKGGGGEPKGELADGDQVRIRQLRGFQNEIQSGRYHALRLRLGLAVLQGRQADTGIAAQSGQSDHDRRQAGDGPGRLGARLLPEVSEPPSGIHRGLVECGELGSDREEFCRR